MNNSAERHLAKAADYVAKGEEFYRKAAEEIVAAKDADPTVSSREIGERFDRGRKWVDDLLAWYSSASALPSPWSGYQEKQGGRNVIGTRKVLRDAPLEQVEQIIAELPPERVQGVAAAAGNAYHKARQDYRETERDLSPAKRKEREAAGEAMTRPVVSAVSSFTIISRLEIALEELKELNASGDVPAQMIDPLDKLINALVEENRVTRAMAGREIDLDEVRS